MLYKFCFLIYTYIHTVHMHAAFKSCNLFEDLFIFVNLYWAVREREFSMNFLLYCEFNCKTCTSYKFFMMVFFMRIRNIATI